MPIHPHKYTKYDGAKSTDQAWMSIFWNDFKLIVSYLRTKILILLCWIPSFLAFLGVIGEFALKAQKPQLLSGASPGGSVLVAFVYIQFFLLVILFATSGCHIVAKDIQNKTLPLYFSRPLNNLHYIGGKITSLFAVGSIATTIPLAFLAVTRITFYYGRANSGSDYAQAFSIVQQMVTAVGISTFMTAFVSLVVVALSAAAKKRAISILSWLGIVMIPFFASKIAMVVADDESGWAQLLSIDGNIYLLLEYFLNTPRDISALIPILILGSISAGALSYLISKLTSLKAVE